jgi:hypothetical protein
MILSGHLIIKAAMPVKRLMMQNMVDMAANRDS